MPGSTSVFSRNRMCDTSSGIYTFSLYQPSPFFHLVCFLQFYTQRSAPHLACRPHPKDISWWGLFSQAHTLRHHVSVSQFHYLSFLTFLYLLFSFKTILTVLFFNTTLVLVYLTPFLVLWHFLENQSLFHFPLSQPALPQVFLPNLEHRGFLTSLEFPSKHSLYIFFFFYITQISIYCRLSSAFVYDF